jgi:signal transduction histidine kinase
MHRGDVLSGAAFSAVLRSSLVFLLVLAAMATFSIRLIDRAMTEEIRLRILEMEQGLRDIAEQDGLAGFPDLVRAVSRGAGGETFAYAVFAADGTRLSGNIDLRPDPGAWLEVSGTLDTSPRDDDSTEPDRYLLHAVRIGELTLVTGRNTAIMASARVAAIRGFALTGFVVVLAMLAIGFALSRRSQTKLERIESTLNRVSMGDVGARTGLGQGIDQIDRISQRVDAHLERLDRLMQGTRRTAASVAHDLRRPLARATLGLERALARAEAGNDPRGEIEEAQADLARLTSIVATILKIARIEGDASGEMQDVDLRAILDEIAETYQPVAEDAGQSLVYERSESPLLLRGEPEMLAQLAVNLVQNALTHAGRGARITLGAAPGPDGLVLSLADDGPGIPEPLRKKVFEPFFRTDTARTVEGSGLGLPLVKAIAERHGARVRLDDAAPGLRVSVSFPQRPGARPPGAARK